MMSAHYALKIAMAVSTGHHYKDHESVYSLDDRFLAKKCKTRECAKNEFDWGQYLRESGVRVPEMLELLRLRKWFIVMQKIPGEDIRDLRGKEREEAERQFREEMGKVLGLGIYPQDSSWGGNAVFDKNSGLYLIDFEHWRQGDEAELLTYRQRLASPDFEFRRHAHWLS